MKHSKHYYEYDRNTPHGESIKPTKKSNAGRKKKPKYESILGDYDDTDLDKKVIKIPEIINQDIGWELQFGMKYISQSHEKQYQRTRKPYYVI